MRSGPTLIIISKDTGSWGRIDLTRAKARLALQTGGAVPAVAGTPSMRWTRAIHPLLFLSHRQQKKTVVPLDLTLSPEARVLVISGPNAGGKSICLKTAGLIQYMFQCGVLPCVKEGSEFMIFNQIFIDIGDEQSLENDLSTYTSKLLNLKYFIENLDGSSLFLVDEMGTGTDPSLGGTIAEAALEEITGKGAWGIVTTHYSNLKLLAGKTPGIVNGAMLFDSKNIRPLYKLRIGQPGSSFAFEIANSIGFPARVLERASGKTGHSQLDFDRQLQDLEVEKQDLTKKSTEVRVADEFLDELITKYQRLNDELERSKKEILAKAREEAAQILKESNRLVEKTIREIRESQADREKTKEVRKELEEGKKKVERVEHQSHSHTPSSRSKEMKLKTSISALPQNLSPSSPYKSYLDELNRKMVMFELTLDLRGTRVDEAFSLLQRYLDDAVLLSVPEVRILHGKGNGVLRQVTRDYLKSLREVKEYHDEVVERGGTGITVVTFR